MFNIKYSTWKSICDMYFPMDTGSLKAYLQWFPFTKLTEKDKETISSEAYFTQYIETSAFIFFAPSMHQSENYLQKSDGSFRDSSLISPILFLILQAVGKEIHDQYTPTRPSDISVYYAGNYKYARAKYKQDYDDFFKELNASIDEFQYFIKTDITNFFSNINVDRLTAQIEQICNANGVCFSQTQLSLYKELLLYCGNGRFPLVENSIASSYLATVIYLDSIDTSLHNYISKNVSCFTSFRIVRYVDDMYILISSDKPNGELRDAYNEIRNEYSSILKEFGLALNTRKCCFKESSEINSELKKSLYDEFYNGQKHNIEEQFHGALHSFLIDLSIELLLDSVDIEKYNDLIRKHFSSSDIEFTPSEVFNYFVYENEEELQSEPVIKEIVELVKHSISFINLDPKRLTVMIMKTKDDQAIKGFMNHLFKKNRADKWNSYDTTIAISYLIQSRFNHIDLLAILGHRHPKLYSYYSNNCKTSFINCFNMPRVTKLCKVIAQDRKAHYLYFMYLCEMKRENYMAAFAYYKNYFDRITAVFEFTYDRQPDDRRPNYKKFYKESAHKKLYAGVENCDSVITKAHILRNANPLSHASSGLIDQENTSVELKQSIKDLSILTNRYLDTQHN